MPSPPAASHDSRPTLGSEPQHVPRFIVGITTPGAIFTEGPSAAAGSADATANIIENENRKFSVLKGDVRVEKAS